MIPMGREAKFVCEWHDIAAIHAWLPVIIDARELTPRQLKDKRARSKQSLIATVGNFGRESHMASHVARSMIVDDAGLGGAAAQPRTRDADAAVAAALDADANPGAARLAGALQRTACATVIALYRSPRLFQHLAGQAPSKRRERQPSARLTESFGQCKSRSTPRLSVRA